MGKPSRPTASPQNVLETFCSQGNEAIMDFARVFTGFDEQNDRGNLEYVDGRNRIDPMRMKA